MLEGRGKRWSSEIKNKFMSRPSEGDFGEFYRHYISLTRGNIPSELISNHAKDIVEFISGIPEEKAGYAYAEGKWTIRQMLQHMMDTERIFVYRLIWIARGDGRSLPGFDENAFAAAAPASHRKLAEMKEEFLLLRRSTDLLIESLTNKELEQRGEASGYPVTVDALCYIIFGHNLHHLEVIMRLYDFT
jgi:uncharacterized damage-inducible protein DinB